MWHVTCCGGWTFSFSFWRFGRKGWLTDLINQYRRCFRTAPATPGLLIICCNTIFNRFYSGTVSSPTFHPSTYEPSNSKFQTEILLHIGTIKKTDFLPPTYARIWVHLFDHHNINFTKKVSNKVPPSPGHLHIINFPICILRQISSYTWLLSEESKPLVIYIWTSQYLVEN